MNWKKCTSRILLASAALAFGTGSALADVPADRPFAMRGIELGITVDQFRAAPMPNDNPQRDSLLQTWCSGDQMPEYLHIEPSKDDKLDGIVECQWFSASHGTTLWQHWVNIGTGGGRPTFQFIESGGSLRLFRIKFYTNTKYYSGLFDALARGYGEPATVIEPFQTLSGSEFTSATSVWDNGLSTITLVERCGHLERYCLTYDHSELVKPYLELIEKRAAAAATKI